MATTTVTITGDISDAIGSDFDSRRTKVYVRHNTSKVVTDDGVPLHLGGGTVNINSDGTFELPNVVASTSLVENLQSTVYIDYADPTTRKRVVEPFGPYDLSGESGTVDIRDLEEVQHLDATAISQATEALEALVAEGQDILDQQEAISGLTGEDDAVALLMSTPSSDTFAAAAEFTDTRTLSPADALPNESMFWWNTSIYSINGRIYVGTCGDNSDVYVNELTQPGGPGQPRYVRRHLLGFAGCGTDMDDHLAPGLAVAEGKPLVAFWSGHSFDNVMHYRATLKNIDDYAENETLTWGPEQTLEMPGDEVTSYCVVRWHGDDIYVMHRTGKPVTRWSMTRFPAWATGTPQRVELFSSTDQFYATFRIVSGIARCIVTDHPSIGTDNKVWYAEANVAAWSTAGTPSGAVTKADGTVLGNLSGTNLPLAEASLELVFTATGSEKPWGFDVGYGTSPEIAFVTGTIGTFSATADYMYGKYSGGSWAVNPITPVGSYLGGAYFPSIAFDPVTPGKVLLARESGGTDYIENWSTANGGTSWTSATVESVLASVTTLTRAWPVESIDGEDPIFDVMATEIDYYPTYTNWISRVRPLPRSATVKRLPDIGEAEPLTEKTGIYLDGTSGCYTLGEDVAVPSGGFSLRWEGALANYTDSQVLISQADSASDRAWWFRTGAGKVLFEWTENGSTLKTLPLTNSIGLAANEWCALRVDVTPAFDATHYWISFHIMRLGDTRWTQIEAFSPAASNTSIYNSAAPLRVGARYTNGTNDRATGIFYSAGIYTRGGTPVAEWKATDRDRGLVYRDENGHPWTLQGKPLAGSAYNAADVFRMGSNYLWINADGNLKIHTSKPTSDSDGKLVADAVIPGDLPATLGLLDSGESTLPRVYGSSVLTAWASGSLRLSYFTARKSETVNNIYAYCTAAAVATPTLCRMGLYTVDGSGNITLVASCANDTTLFSATGKNVRALATPYAKVAGQRYALGILVVTGAAMPTFAGAAVSSAISRDAPVLTGAIAGQTDLPSSVTVGSLTTSGSMPNIAVTP